MVTKMLFLVSFSSSFCTLKILILTIRLENDQDVVAIGPLILHSAVDVIFYVNAIDDNVPVCHLLGCSTCLAPIQVIPGLTQTVSGDVLYTIAKDTAVASARITDQNTASTDFINLLMLDPLANHSFVYYAASIDFVGDYLQSLHSNDVSVFIVTALASNVEVRVAPSKEITINDKIVQSGEETIVILNVGQTITVTSSEDLTGSRVTANKAISFYSGHYCATGSTENCSILIEQIPPYNSWKNSFILHTNINVTVANMFKFIASDVGAHIQLQCTTNGEDIYFFSSFHLGFRQHRVLNISQDHCVVNTDEDILIIQYSSSNQSPMNTFMTVVQAIPQFEEIYIISTPNYQSIDSYVALTVTATNPSLNPLLLNNVQTNITWESVNIDGNTHYYTVLSLPYDNRHRLEFLGSDVEFGAIMFEFNHTNIYAFPAGMKLSLMTDLPMQGINISTFSNS